MGKQETDVGAKQETDVGAKQEPSSEVAAEPALMESIPVSPPERLEQEAKTGATARSEHPEQETHIEMKAEPSPEL